MPTCTTKQSTTRSQHPTYACTVAQSTKVHHQTDLLILLLVYRVDVFLVTHEHLLTHDVRFFPVCDVALSFLLYGYIFFTIFHFAFNNSSHQIPTHYSDLDTHASHIRNSIRSRRYRESKEPPRNRLYVALHRLFFTNIRGCYDVLDYSARDADGSHSEGKDKTNINNILRINARLPSSEIQSQRQ